MTKPSNIIAAAAVLLAVTSAPAIAGDQPAQVAVSYADLNLDHPDGQRVLKARIKRAAMKVCGHRRGRVSLGQSRHVASCMDVATERAMLALSKQRKTRLAARAGTDGEGR